MQHTVQIPLRTYFPRNAEVGFLEECLEKYFNQILIEPQPSNKPPKQNVLRRFYTTEYNEYLDYDEEDERKFLQRCGYCSVDLEDYLEQFPEVALLKPFYVNYNNVANRRGYEPLLMSLYLKVDLFTLHRFA